MSPSRARSAALAIIAVLVPAGGRAEPAPEVGRHGVIEGAVISAETGLPLPGVSILAAGTALGAATDLDGRFRIALPAGTYTVQVTSIGYVPDRRTGVVVPAGDRVRVDFRLVPAPDIILEPVEVTGDELIDPESSTSRRVIRGEDVRSIPVDDVLDAIALSAGIVSAAGDLHFRGGRTGEVLYQLDGIPARDPLSTRPFSISTVALAESEVLTGGFDAEYGNAQSGVVEFKTREGGESFAAEARFETDDYGAPDRTFTNFDRLALGLGGPLGPPGLAYFASYEGTFDDTYLKTREERSRRRLLDFITLGPRQENETRWTAKTSYRAPGSRHRVSLERVENRELADVYLHAWSRAGYVQVFEELDASGNTVRRYGRWALTPLDSTYVPYNAAAHTPDRRSRFSITKLNWSRQAGESLLEARLAFLRSTDRQQVPGKGPGEYEVVFPDYWEGNFEEGFYYVTHGDFPLFSERASQVWTLRIDGRSALPGSRRSLKGGLLLSHNHLELLQLDFPNEINPAGSPGRFRSELAIDNPEGAFYVQGHWKHEGLVANAGLRYDFFSLGNQFDALAADERVRDQWSPRLGIAFPISDREALSFHYGRYFQIPDRRFVFEERTSNVRIRGNLNLEPEVTVAYQAAVQRQMTPDVAFTATIFFKDIFGLLTTERREVPGFVELVDVWTNQDFATARGLELALRKRTGAPLWGELAYTLSRATGVASSAEERILNQDVETALAAEEVPLDWDQRHTANGTIHIGYPGDWAATFIATYGSGLPYTPTRLGERVRRLSEHNAARLPSTFRLDSDLSKHFGAWGQRFVFSVRGFNLLDSDNIRQLAPDNTPHAFASEDDYVVYYTETGEAGGAVIDVDEQGAARFVPLHDPRVWERGRVVRVGLGWSR